MSRSRCRSRLARPRGSNAHHLGFFRRFRGFPENSLSSWGATYTAPPVTRTHPAIHHRRGGPGKGGGHLRPEVGDRKRFGTGARRWALRLWPYGPAGWQGHRQTPAQTTSQRPARPCPCGVRGHRVQSNIAVASTSRDHIVYYSACTLQMQQPFYGHVIVFTYKNQSRPLRTAAAVSTTSAPIKWPRRRECGARTERGRERRRRRSALTRH